MIAAKCSEAHNSHGSKNLGAVQARLFLATPLWTLTKVIAGRIRVKSLRIDGERLADELVPMGLATRMINLRVYRRDASATRLTGIAHAFAALAPVYTHNLDGSEIRQLTRQELNSGFFRKDGAEFQFLDGRPRIVNIAVTTRAIDLVTETLSDPNSAERELRSLPQVS